MGRSGKEVGSRPSFSEQRRTRRQIAETPACLTFAVRHSTSVIRRFADTRFPVASVIYEICAIYSEEFRSCGLFLRLGFSFIQAPFPFGTKEPTIVFDCHDGEITVENRIAPYDPLSGLSEST
jgi:hypothetical protein